MSSSRDIPETIEISIDLIDGTTEKFTMTDGRWSDIDSNDGMLMLRSLVNGRHAMTLIPLHRIAIMHATGDLGDLNDEDIDPNAW